VRRPQHATVVAYIALFAALTGTATAAGLINGKQLKDRSVSGVKLRKNSVTGTEVKEASLSEVPLARTAAQATHASTSDQATAATTAGNARQLGGLAPAAFQSRVRWALVNAAGSIVSQSGGITVDRTYDGTYVFGLGEPVAGKAIIATPHVAFTSTARFDVSTAPCGTDPVQGHVSCGSSYDDGRHVQVMTADSYMGTGGTQDAGFYVAVIG
jgi:hypothetical protein